MSIASALAYILIESEDEVDLTDFKRILSDLPSDAVLAARKLRQKILSGTSRESQYASDYLETNRSRGDGLGLTLGSYLAGTLRGAAKSYSGRYKRALENAMTARVAAGLAKRGTSRLGGEAWYPVDVADDDV